MAGPTTQRAANEESILARPEVGTALTIASGLSFLFLCMILPLVGKAGAQTAHYGKNFAAFLAVLFITGGLAGLAVYAKLLRRRQDASPLPKFSLSILGLSLLLLIALIAGLLKI
jgi:hypothetical protein